MSRGEPRSTTDIEDNYRDYTLPRNAEDEDDMNSDDFNEDPS